MTDLEFKGWITTILVVVFMGGIMLYFIFLAIRTKSVSRHDKPSESGIKEAYGHVKEGETGGWRIKGRL